MAEQSLDHNEQINVRWAYDDPNPRRIHQIKQNNEEQLLQAMIDKGGYSLDAITSDFYIPTDYALPELYTPQQVAAGTVPPPPGLMAPPGLMPPPGLVADTAGAASNGTASNEHAESAEPSQSEQPAKRQRVDDGSAVPAGTSGAVEDSAASEAVAETPTANLYSGATPYPNTDYQYPQAPAAQVNTAQRLIGSAVILICYYCW